MSIIKHKPPFSVVFRESLMVLIAAVLIWRGIWVLLDLVDERFFGGSHVLSAIIGIAIGGVMVYFADRDLEDLV